MRIGAFAVALLLVAGVAEATITRAMSFEDKVENAASIIVGRCVSQESQWDAARQWILTYSTFRVEKTLKGVPSQEITIVTPGGTVGTIAQEVVGAPRFRKGDDRVLFVRNSQAGQTVLYFDQGAYEVRADARGERIVHPTATPAVVVDTQRGRAVATEEARPLKDFEQLVRDTNRRREAFRMEVIERRQKEQASLWNHVRRNKALVILALVGALLATWQLIKRS